MPHFTDQALKDCNTSMDALFTGLKPTAELQGQVNAIKRYYKETLTDVILKYPDEIDWQLEIIEQYQKLVTVCSDVKLGQRSTDEALVTLKKMTNKRLNITIIHNILNACALLFWAAIGLGSIAVNTMVGIPLLLLQPWLGLLLITSTSMSYLAGVYNAIECCFDFHSSTPIHEEGDRYNALISFFKPGTEVVVNAARPGANPAGLFYGDDLRTDATPAQI